MMGRAAPLLVGLISLLAVGPLGCGPPPAPAPQMTVMTTPLGPRLDRVAYTVGRAARALQVPGVSVAVVDRGVIVWAGGWGQAVIETGAEATSQSVYRIGALSRVIAGTLLLRLAARGVVDLDAAMGEDVSGLSEPTASLTARQLFERSPGSGGASTDATDLLVALVVASTGRSYADVLHDEVFAPAEMASAHVDSPGLHVPVRAGLYRRGDDGIPIPMSPTGQSQQAPFVGALASVTDLARYVIALDDGVLIDAADDISTGSARTLGWQVGADPGGHRWVGQGDGVAYVFRRPEQRFAVVVLTNLAVDPSRLSAVARQIEGAWRGR